MERSIYERELGEDFDNLHPLLQKKFGLVSEQKLKVVGTGTMDFIRGGKRWLAPFFYVGARQHVLFPERGEQIPFTIENVAYKDIFGRETVAWIRRFQFERRTRAFDATMIYSEKSGTIIDYLGKRQWLISPLTFEVTDDGGLLIKSDSLYFWIGAVKIKAPKWLSPHAVIHERVCGKTNNVLIHVSVEQPGIGMLIEYKGVLQMTFHTCLDKDIPNAAFPQRVERRE